MHGDITGKKGEYSVNWCNLRAPIPSQQGKGSGDVASSGKSKCLLGKMKGHLEEQMGDMSL